MIDNAAFITSATCSYFSTFPIDTSTTPYFAQRAISFTIQFPSLANLLSISKASCISEKIYGAISGSWSTRSSHHSHLSKNCVKNWLLSTFLITKPTTIIPFSRGTPHFIRFRADCQEQNYARLVEYHRTKSLYYTVHIHTMP